MNRLVDSRNCYELIQRGFVIPRTINNHERIRTLDEIIVKDKGGMIFSPKIGLHENSAFPDANEIAQIDCLDYLVPLYDNHCGYIGFRDPLRSYGAMRIVVGDWKGAMLSAAK